MSKPMRSITVDGETYHYRVGNRWCEIRWEGHKLAVPLDALTGNTQDNINRGRWKKNMDGMVKPSQVAGYISAVIAQGGKHEQAELRHCRRQVPGPRAT